MNNLPVRVSFFVIIFASLVTWLGCKTNELVAEPAKDISGTWKIEKIVQNGRDLTDWMDGGEFQLVFSRDTGYNGMGGRYKIIEAQPFVVSTDGTWQFDSPYHPVYISFSPHGGAKPVPVKFLYPVIEGKRQISLIFSPGCPSNTYEYLLKKVGE